MTELLRDLWYFGATSRELKPGAMFRREILGEPVLLGRDETGAPFALRDICPHRAVPLSAGQQMVQDGTPVVQCPYHGWRFGARDGVCRHIPTLVEGQPYEIERIRVRAYPVHEAAGIVFIFVGADARASAAPGAPPALVSDDYGAPKFTISRIFQANMDNSVVGLMDPAHVPYVHNQWYWRPPSTKKKLKEKRFEPFELGWGIAKHQPSSNSLAYRALFGGDVTTEIRFMLPGYRWEIVENAKARFLTLTCLTPLNDNATRITQITYWRHAPLLDLIKPLFIPAAAQFLDQDRRMVDLQNTGLAYDASMLWIDDIDVQAKWYLKLKRAWAKSREEGVAFENPLAPATLRWMS